MPPAVIAPNRGRRACASVSHTTNLEAYPMLQAHAAPTRGLPPPDRRPLLLPLRASAQATRTRPRHQGVASIARTPHNEGLKAPAKTAARAPPHPAGHPRLTTRSYPPLPLSPAATRRSSSLSSCTVLLVWLIPETFVVPSVATSLRAPVQSSCTLTQAEPTEATVTAGRGKSVVREIRRRSQKKRC